MRPDLPAPAEPTAADIAAGLWLLGQALLLEGLTPPPQREKQIGNN